MNGRKIINGAKIIEIENNNMKNYQLLRTSSISS